MSCTIVFTLLACVAHVHAKDSMDNLLDVMGAKLMDKLVDRAFEASSLHQADLNDVALAKPSQVATAPQKSMTAVLPRMAGAYIEPFRAQSLSTPASWMNSQPQFGSTIAHATNKNIQPTAMVDEEVGSAVNIENIPTLKSVSVALVGLGGVGNELVKQIESQKAQLKDKGFDVSVIAVARSKVMYLGDEEVAAAGKSDGVPTDLEKLGQWMAQQEGEKIMVDCSADDSPADSYASWLAAGMDVVTPNKKLGSGPLKRYQDTFNAAKSGGSHFFYEATVGAGLPIITTLQDLRNTGDKVDQIEGILSGTLSYLFNEGAGKPFSAVVQDAAEKGFTEPDPRDDLSGLDVQRKTVILARECGLNLELADVPVESLVPAPLQSWEPTDADKATGIAKVFVEKLKEYDGDMAKRMADADAAGEVLRYVGTIDVPAGKASVGLRAFPKNHPFAATQYADNIVSFATERYTPRPLVVQGPGAGGAVTAAGVFGDMLRAAERC